MTQKNINKHRNIEYKFKCILCGNEFEKEQQLFYHYQHDCDGGW